MKLALKKQKNHEEKEKKKAHHAHTHTYFERKRLNNLEIFRKNSGYKKGKKRGITDYCKLENKALL